jgi:hypothetical protein
MQTRPLLLKLGATAVTLGATLASALYVTAHLKNPNAPLQPSVLSESSSASVDVPGGGTLTISPSLRPSDVQPVTSTYAS